MIAEVGQLARRVIVVQVAVGLVVALLLTIFGPRLLLVPREIALAAIRFGLGWGLVVGALAVALIRHRLKTHRFLLRALVLGSSAVEPEDVQGLLRIPSYVATVTISLGLVVPLAFVSPLRPSIIDVNAALSFALLIFVIVAMSALPLLVLIRAAVSRVIELVHPDVMQTLLEREKSSGAHRRRVLARLLAALAMPIGFVAVGAALIAHAHVRSFDARSRERTAEAIAYALEPIPSFRWSAGRSEAMRAAHRLGFAARVSDEVLPFSVHRDEDGRISLTVPFDNGSAILRFAGSHLSALTGADVGLALAAVLLASIFGLAVGRSLTSDLVRATERLEGLSTEEVLRGRVRAAPLARFRIVRNLNAAIDRLTERFRVFAEAQERAIESREIADRSRALLFASVSHDLRNPLNAILGFTTLVAETPLVSAQRESLEIIERRGRELLVLIETILELARAEAGQLELLRQPVSVATLVADGVRKGYELAAGRPIEVVAEIEPELPEIAVDSRRLVLAIAALIGHSARIGEMAGGLEGSSFPVHVRATMPSEKVEIEIEHREGVLPTAQVERLLKSEPDVVGQRRYGGLMLGLSLARAIVELHGGTLRATRGPLGTTRLRIGLG